MEINWKDEMNKGNPVYPTGTYKVQIKSFERCEAKTGTKQIRWKAEIIDPPEYCGRTITDHTALTEKALWRIVNLITACGVDLTDVRPTDTDSETFKAVCQSCVGRYLYWRNQEEVNPNTGAMRNSIVEYVIDGTQDKIKPVFCDDAPIAWDE